MDTRKNQDPVSDFEDRRRVYGRRRNSKAITAFSVLLPGEFDTADREAAKAQALRARLKRPARTNTRGKFSEAIVRTSVSGGREEERAESF